MKGFFITTAIDYPTAKPHLGHAYEKIISDTIARARKLSGEKVFFSTGTDEHGKKVLTYAKNAGKQPKEFVDVLVKSYLDLCEKLDINYTKFIRTTDGYHEKSAKDFYQALQDNGDLYKGTYSGLYCEPCERYYTEKELDGKQCPVHKKDCEELTEETYFFKLSKYQKPLLEFFEKNPEFIVPKIRRKEIVNRVKEGLLDLSVSRSSFDWGVKVPFDEKHVIYVWIEALLNYVTVIGFPKGKDFEAFWPADIHVIGKDISWFHTVIWPCLLLSAEIPLPKSVLVHGFINTGKHEKLSKTTKTLVDPIALIEKYSSDALRYYLLREASVGEDLLFSEKNFQERLNSELADIIGNLVHRTLVFVDSKFDGVIPKPEKESFSKQQKEFLKLIETEPKEIAKLYDNPVKLKEALNACLVYAKKANEFFQSEKPWETIKTNKQQAANSLFLLSNFLASLSIVLHPVLPKSTQKVWGYLNLEGKVEEQLFANASKLLVKEGQKISKPELLFKKVDDREFKKLQQL
ncbi:MAG: methionine--tRNA ligase [archaeon]